MKKIFKYAIVQTTPIMLGYVFMGAAWGLMLQNAGFNAFWAFVIALTVYTGSGQFLMVSMLCPGYSLLSIFVMQLSINSRHMFYGLSFLERFRKMKKVYPYMIFSLTDETYSLLCYTKIPEELDQNRTTLVIALMDQSYWLIGCTLGALLGEFRLFDITGVDFAMTALFVVIFVEQWISYRNHIPVFVGFLCGIVSLILIGPDNFILPSLFVAVGVLLLAKNVVQKKSRDGYCEDGDDGKGGK